LNCFAVIEYENAAMLLSFKVLYKSQVMLGSCVCHINQVVFLLCHPVDAHRSLVVEAILTDDEYAL